MNEQIEMPEEFTLPRGAGPRLRLAREQAGLSIADVAARTRISSRQIEHIEAGDYAAFPSRTYVLGFARSIAKAVGLDPQEIAGQLREDLDEYLPPERERHQPFEPGDPARAPSRGLLWFSLVAVALLLAGLFFAYRTLFTPAAELPSLVAGEEAPAAGGAPAAAASGTAAAAASPSGPVVFTAREDGVWVRFYDADGRRLMEGEMAAGQSYTVPADARGPQLWTGRPEALTITVGGRAVPPLATEMVTMRDVPVDAAALLARPAPTASSTANPGGSPTAAVSLAAPLRTTPLSEGARSRMTALAAPVRAVPSVRRAPAAPGNDGAAATAAANTASASEVAGPVAEEPAPTASGEGQAAQ